MSAYERWRQRRTACAAWLVTCALLFGARPATAGPTVETTTDKAKECLRLCNPDSFRCNETMVDCLIQAQHASVAVEAAQKVLAKRPDRPAYQRLLAYAYLAAGQPDLATQRLRTTIEKHPRDCQSRSMAAWIYSRQKRLDLAAKALAKHDVCPNSPAEAARWALMRAYLAFLKGDILSTQSLLVSGEGTGAVYPEDIPLWAHMLRRVRPNRHAPLQLNLDLGLGGNTNARGAVPLPSVPDDQGTGQLRLGLSGTLTGPPRWYVRPRLEGAVLISMLENFGEVDVSNLNNYVITARPGMLIDIGRTTLDLSYRGTLAVLKAPNPVTGVSPTVAAESHRGEFDLMLPRGFTVLTGFGRSLAVQESRSRWDYNGGGGWRHLFHNGHMLAVAGSFFYYDADIDLYRQYGGSLAGNYGFPIAPGFTCQLRFSWTHNYFPNNPSGGGYMSVIGTGGVLWANLGKTTQVGLQYAFDYAGGTTLAVPEYTAHSLFVAARWNFSWNPWAPKPQKPDGHVTLDYQLEEKANYGRDVRVQDLLRRTNVPQQAQ